MRNTLVLLLAAALGIFGQSCFSSHSGWNFDDTLQTASEIVVADIVRGAGIDTESQVSAKAEIHIVRVLQGSPAPGAKLTVQSTYQPGPMETPAASADEPRGVPVLADIDGTFCLGNRSGLDTRVNRSRS